MINFFEIWVAFKYLFPKTKDKFFSIITLFSFLGISLGVATLIIVMSVMNGFREELTSKILGINGHLKVQSLSKNDNSSYNKVKKRLNNEISNINITEVLTSQGLISYKGYSSGVITKGVSPEMFNQRKIFKNKIDKKQLIAFSKNNGIFIGEKLRKRLNIREGDFINILSSDGYETILGKIPRSGNFKVVGFFNTGMFEYDTSLIIFPIFLLQEFLGVKNKIDFLEIELDKFNNFEFVKQNILKTIPKNFKIVDWRSLNPSLFNAIEVEKNVMFLILLLIIVVAAFNLISSMIILVSNKRKDIGVLRVLGVSKFSLLKIFIINGSFIGFCGTILGLVLGLIFCLNINEIKKFLELFTEKNLFSEEIYFFSNMPVIIDYQQILTIILISLILSFLATIYPSWR
ncbi:MAG: Lipoprotein-releasing system transmembrane protein LolC, partial [Alphaproteobacteria bacterium MarineAlpha8_Bin1]